jgi:hypothetical protein
MFDDDQETPNTLCATFEFNEGGKKKMLVFEVRHWISNQEAGISGEKGRGSVGDIFYGSEGYMTRERFGYKTFLGREQQPGPGRVEAGNHFGNFIAAVRSRKRSDLNAEIEEGATSCILVHLANISYLVGRTLNFDSRTLTCIGDEEANRMLTRTYRPPFVVPEKV